MTFTGFNFRLTSGFVTDGPNDVYAGLTGNSYSASPGYGWVGSGGLTGGDGVNTNDPRVAGTTLITTTTYYRVDVPNGDYDIAVAVGPTGGNSSANVRVRVGSGSTANTDYFDIGSNAAAFANTSSIDATNASLLNTAWPASNAKKRVTVTQGFFQVQHGTTVTLVRHFAYQAAFASPSVAGQAATAAQGTITLSVGVNPSGQSTTSAIGAATGGPGPIATGQSLTSASGSVNAAPAPALTGQANTVSAGAINSVPALTLLGQAGTVGRGTIIFGPAPSITGQSTTSAQGSVATTAPSGLNLTGQAATAAAGTVIPTPSKSLGGLAATVGQGAPNFPAKFVAIAGQGATSRMGWVVTPVPIFHGVNFRLTQGFVTDGPNDIWCGAPVFNSYNAAIGYGWAGNAGSVGNGSSSDDPRVAGSAFLSGSPTFRWDVPNGSYKLRVAIGTTGGAAATRQARILVGAGGVLGTDYFDIKNPSLNTQTSLQSLDATGGIWNNTDWPTSTATIDVVVTQGFVSTNGFISGGSLIRHIALAPQGVSAVALSGQSLTVGRGNVATTGPVSVAITGQAMTAGRGTIAIVGIVLTGQQLIVSQAGPVSSGPDFTTQGQSATVNQSGPVQALVDLTTFGLSATVSQGPFVAAGVPGGATLTGQATTISQGVAPGGPAPALSSFVLTAAITTISGAPRHDVTYDITRGYDGGAFDPGGFYSSISPYSIAQQGQVVVSSNVPALRSTALISGQGALTYTVNFLAPAQPMTSGQGSAIATLMQSISGLQMSTRQGGDIYTFFPGFFDGTVEDLYVPSEENVLYVPQDVTDMLVT